jgi:hypothetical protein
MWLLTRGRRYELAGASAVQLGLQRAPAVALPAEILDLTPEGPKIKAPDIPDKGTAAAGIPHGWLVADVLRVPADSGPRQSFVVLPDGLNPISDLTATLLVASGSREITTDTAAVSAAPQSPAPGNRGWPDVLPALVGPQRDQPLCFSTTPGDPAGDAPWEVRTSLPGVVLMPGEQAVHTGTGDVPGVVDEVVPRGSGALVRASTASGGDGALTLVTDSGQRYPIPDRDAATRLHYDAAAVRQVPASFVRLLPVGPALDPLRAAKEFPGH